MTTSTVRRISLPADPRSQSAAAATVRALVEQVGLNALLDDALVLTNELVNAAITHDRGDITVITVEVLAEASALTVTVFTNTGVTNIGSGVAGTDASPAPENGRVMAVLHERAGRWGTMHHRGGNAVWFQLCSAGTPLQAWPTHDPLAALGPLPDGHDPDVQLAELVRRMARACGAGAAALILDENDGRGPQVIASYGPPPGPDAATREPLPLTRPWRGEMLLDMPASADMSASGPVVTLAAERIALLLENSRLRQADTRRRAWLTFLAEASDLLAQSLDVELTYALIPMLVVPRLAAWCAVHIRTNDALVLVASAHAEEAALPALHQRLAQAGEQLAETLATDAPVPLAGPIEGLGVALIARSQRIGTLTVGREEASLDADELAAVEDLAYRAALAIDNNRIVAERRSIAAALQRSLLPPTLPVLPGIELGAQYTPAGGMVEVGGDFYDVVALPDGRWLVVIGDVSGKGVQAATVTGLVRDVTRVLARDGRSVSDVLARLNDTLLGHSSGRFCTVAMAALDRRRDGRVEAQVYLAGHDQPLLVAADSTPRQVGRCGTALGLLPEIRVCPESVLLEPGDMMIFCTDGVTERRNRGVFFGPDRLFTEASALAGFPADVVAARLRAAAVAYSPDPPRDDIAILTVRNDCEGVPVAGPPPHTARSARSN